MPTLCAHPGLQVYQYSLYSKYQYSLPLGPCTLSISTPCFTNYQYFLYTNHACGLQVYQYSLYTNYQYSLHTNHACGLQVYQYSLYTNYETTVLCELNPEVPEE